ncbi:MAG: ferredoxin [Saprospiraceae bacterium]|nr:ferredoxin [Saprospiraceae bacterium]
MEKEKQIAFGDYFKEDPFQSNLPTGVPETDLKEKQADARPVLRNEPRADDAERRKYYQALRRFFADGTKTGKCLTMPVAPVLLAAFLRGQHPDTDFPVFYDFEAQTLSPVRSLLQEVHKQLFKEGEASLLGQNLLRLEAYLRQSLTGKKPEDYGKTLEEAFSHLKMLEVHGEEGQLFVKSCDRLEEELMNHQGVIIDFSSRTPFQLLNLEIGQRQKSTRQLVDRIRKLISGIKELLQLHHSASTESRRKEQEPDDLISSMVSFSAVEQLMPADASAGWTSERLQRIQSALATLEHAVEFFQEHTSMVFVTADLAREFALDTILKETTLDITTGHPCAKAEAYFRSEMNDLVGIIASMRLAELELANAYEEDLHNTYFDRFGFVNLREEDIQLLPPLLVIAESRQLLQEPEDLLALLTDNAPIKVFAVNRLSDLALPDEDPDQPVFRQELAALALSHRNAYIFQGTSDQPEALHQALQTGLYSPLPVLWNVLFADQAADDSLYDFTTLNTACESRTFPRLAYNILAGEQFGSRFTIAANPQAGRQFACYDLEVMVDGKPETLAFTLTPADFYAMDPVRTAELEVIPPSLYPDVLMPLQDYLNTPVQALAEHLPFIWVLDDENRLHKAAVPFSWLAPCKERLDNWQFIQELGGVNSYHVSRAIELARTEWEAEKVKEIEELKADMDAKIEHIRKEEGGKAMDRLVNVLLDLDHNLSAVPSATAPKTQALPMPADKPKQVDIPAPEPEEKEEEISAEAWIETFRCTTCNDCINAVPGVFKYNGDKQAIVHNPQGGTYALIVAAAEKCPARCIHPGLPQHPDEPNLEALIKRAEQFN